MTFALLAIPKCLKRDCVVITHGYTFSFLPLIVIHLVAKAQNFIYERNQIHIYSQRWLSIKRITKFIRET